MGFADIISACQKCANALSYEGVEVSAPIVMFPRRERKMIEQYGDSYKE